MDPARLMQVIEQGVQSNNNTLFERVIDKEIFEKVFKGVRNQLFKELPHEDGVDMKKVIENGQKEIELQGKIREIGRKLMKEMRLSEEIEIIEEEESKLGGKFKEMQ